LKEYKNIVIALIVTVIIVLIIYFVGKRAGKKYIPSSVDLPSDTPTGGNYTFNPGPYTDALYQDIYEKVGLRNKQAYTDFLNLGNSQIVAVYNDWNKRYYSEDNETLTQAIDGEYFGISIYDWTSIKSQILSRLAALNLK
jgi:hypothetical protein